jgi:hypothetical protein
MVNSGRYIHTTHHSTAQHSTAQLHTYTHTHIHTTITDIQYIYIPTLPPINGEVYVIAIEAEVYDTADTAVIPAVQFGS